MNYRCIFINLDLPEALDPFLVRIRAVCDIISKLCLVKDAEPIDVIDERFSGNIGKPVISRRRTIGIIITFPGASRSRILRVCHEHRHINTTIPINIT